MIINGDTLLAYSPITDMHISGEAHGTSYGLTEIGYDIRCAEDIVFNKGDRFTLASSMEYFSMPSTLCARVCDKSTWAREGIGVFNTLIKPGWKGYLTLEVVNHTGKEITIKAGSGIAQVVFEQLSDAAQYKGVYQNQESGPQHARKHR